MMIDESEDQRITRIVAERNTLLRGMREIQSHANRVISKRVEPNLPTIQAIHTLAARAVGECEQ